MDATEIAEAREDYSIEFIEAQAADLEKAINDWALPSLIPTLRVVRRAAIVQRGRDELVAALGRISDTGGIFEDIVNEHILPAEKRAELLRQHDAEVAARALRDAAQAWAEDPDAVGDSFIDARNWLRDRADELPSGS
jgi:dihydropteroate synthase